MDGWSSRHMQAARMEDARSAAREPGTVGHAVSEGGVFVHPQRLQGKEGAREAVVWASPRPPIDHAESRAPAKTFGYSSRTGGGGECGACHLIKGARR